MQNVDSTSRESIVYLRSLIGHLVHVTTRSGEQYRGRLRFVEDDMSIHLREVQSIDVNAIANSGDLRIAGDHIENAQLFDAHAEGDERTDTNVAITLDGNDEMSVEIQEYRHPVEESLSSLSHADSGHDSRLIHGSEQSNMWIDDEQPGPSTSCPSLTTPRPRPSTTQVAPRPTQSDPSPQAGPSTLHQERSNTHPRLPSTSAHSSIIYNPAQTIYHYVASIIRLIPRVYHLSRTPYQHPSSRHLAAPSIYQNSRRIFPRGPIFPFDVNTGLSLLIDGFRDPLYESLRSSFSRVRSGRDPRFLMVLNGSVLRNLYFYEDLVWPRAPNPSPNSSMSGRSMFEPGSNLIQSESNSPSTGTYGADPGIRHPDSRIHREGSHTYQRDSSVFQSGPVTPQISPNADIPQPGSDISRRDSYSYRSDSSISFLDTNSLQNSDGANQSVDPSSSEVTVISSLPGSPGLPSGSSTVQLSSTYSQNGSDSDTTN